MGASNSVHTYNRLPDDDLEFVKLNDSTDSTEEILFAEKTKTSIFDNCNKWMRERKQREEEKQKKTLEKINQELMRKKMILELVEIAKSALKDKRPAPISDDEVKAVLQKYGDIGHSKELYNIIDVEPQQTPRQGWEGLCQNGWYVCIDREDVNELVMVVTKCIWTDLIETYELILENGKGYLSYCGENGKFAYVRDQAMKHFVFSVTSAGISDLDLYEGNPNARSGRESEQEYRLRRTIRRAIYSSSGGYSNSMLIGGFGGMTGGFGGGFGGGCGGGGF